MNVLAMLFDFRGRINRAKFWLSMLIWAAFFLVVVGTGMATGSMNVVFGLALVAYIPIIASSIAVGTKRLHDRNKSAWWLMVFYGVPVAMPFLAAAFGGGFDESSSSGGTVMQYFSLAISLWALIELGTIRGTIGGNPHGPDPVAPRPAQH